MGRPGESAPSPSDPQNVFPLLPGPPIRGVWGMGGKDDDWTDAPDVLMGLPVMLSRFGGPLELRTDERLRGRLVGATAKRLRGTELTSVMVTVSCRCYGRLLARAILAPTLAWAGRGAAGRARDGGHLH